MTKILDKLPKWVIWFLLPAISGLLFSYYAVWKRTYAISLNLDLSNVVTIIFATYFTTYVVRQLSLKDGKTKIKFDHLTALVSKFEDDFFKKIKEIVHNKSVNIQVSKALLKNHGTSISKIEEIAVKHGYLTKNSGLFKIIKKNHKELRVLIETSSNVITVTEQEFKYSENQAFEIDKKIVERQLLIFELTVVMSNH